MQKVEKENHSASLAPCQRMSSISMIYDFNIIYICFVYHAIFYMDWMPRIQFVVDGVTLHSTVNSRSICFQYSLIICIAFKSAECYFFCNSSYTLFTIPTSNYQKCMEKSSVIRKSHSAKVSVRNEKGQVTDKSNVQRPEIQTKYTELHV